MSIGTDYGFGQSNIDQTNGIRYGVIHQNDIHPDMLSEAFLDAEDLSIDTYREVLKAELAHEYDDEDELEDRVDEELEFHESEGPFRYEGDDCTLLISEMDIIVLSSSYTTECKFCSPCFPGAGDLSNPVEGGVKTYCLGPDWFDGEPPYLVTKRN